MLTLLAAALLAQVPPAPPPPPRPPEPPMAWVSADGPGGMDRNNDGQITREEFTAPMNDAFTRLDRDGDGVVSREEMTGGHTFHIRTDGPDDAPGDARHAERMMVMVGPDGQRREMVLNGGEDIDEVIEDGPNRQVRVRTFTTKDGETVMLRGGPDGPGGPRIRMLRDGPGERQNLDKDGDGRVSEAEFTAQLADAFRRMDTDGSGYLEEGERGSTNVQVFTRRIDRDAPPVAED